MGGIHECEKTQDQRGISESTNKRAQYMVEEDQGRSVYKNTQTINELDILQRHPKLGRRGRSRSGGLTSPPLKNMRCQSGI